jgi:hypothetical protein
VSRQLKALAPCFQLTVAGFDDPPVEAHKFVKLERPAGGVSLARIGRVARLIGRRFESYYWSLPSARQALDALAGSLFDLVVANDIDALPLAVALAKDAPLLLDAHEYAPRENEEQWAWRVFRRPYVEHLCRRYLARCRAMTTVAPGIAEAYRTAYGVRPEVVYNAPAYADLQPTPVAGQKIRMIHHGGAAVARRLETMIEVMDLLDQRFELDFMLVPGDRSYIARLEALARRNPRIRMLSPVPMDQIAPFTNRYDIGIYILAPTSFNTEHALPNKFFEFIQARLAVAIGPSPEMRALAHRYDCGVVAQDFSPRSLAAELSKLTPERLTVLKANAHRAAADLCFEKSAPAFQAAVDRAMQMRTNAP